MLVTESGMVTLVKLEHPMNVACTRGATSTNQHWGLSRHYDAHKTTRGQEYASASGWPEGVTLGAFRGLEGETHSADACHGARDGHAGQAGASQKRGLHTRGHRVSFSASHCPQGWARRGTGAVSLTMPMLVTESGMVTLARSSH